MSAAAQPGPPAQGSPGQPLGAIEPAQVPAGAPSVPGGGLPVAMPAGGPPDAGEPDRPDIAASARLGLIIALLFFGGVGGWAALAPLDSAAIAMGSVKVEGNRKTVQHLEGGIVGEILVRDGDPVTAGQTLIRLDVTRPRAELELLRGRLAAAVAQEARLKAERDNAEAVDFPVWLLDRSDDPEIAETLYGQLAIFDARQDALTTQRAVLAQSEAQLAEEIRGLQAEIAAQERQLELIGEEIEGQEILTAKGLARKERILALKREQAQISGARGQNLAAIARARQSISEARLRITELESQRINEAVAELREVQASVFDLQKQIRAAEDVLARTEIVSPASGRVVNLAVHTTGGVISPGQPLLDVVPALENLVVDAQVMPTDIDIVQAGMRATIRLSALNQRTTPTFEARVAWVSADALTDEASGASYYRAIIRPDEAALKAASVQLLPGMPVEVMIVVGERTFLDYLTKPLEQSMSRAFTEQ